MAITTLDSLKEQGGIFSNYGQCSFCGDSIEWWKVKSKSVPYDLMATGSSPAIHHSRTCKNPPEAK